MEEIKIKIKFIITFILSEFNLKKNYNTYSPFLFIAVSG